MKNILRIIASDFRRLTSSVVPIIIILGICIVPCLFAWFNILSNWDPFEEEATGRIPIAVVSEDDGVDMMGLYVNVGEKALDAMKGNDMIKWTFVSSRERAVRGTLAGDYYAAIVFPEDFSEDVLSFASGDPQRPTVLYYENEKKNAIAAKITDKVKTALQDEVDSVFVGTIARYISEASEAADAMGLDPRDLFGDLGGMMSDLRGDLEDAVLIMEAAGGLTDAANELMKASGGMISGTERSLTAGEKLLDAGEKALPDKEKTKPIADAVKKEAQIISEGLDQLHGDLSKVRDDMDAFNAFVEKDLQVKLKLVEAMKESADTTAAKLRDMGLTGLAGRFERLSAWLGKVYDKLATLKKADEDSWPEIQKTLDDLLLDIGRTEKIAEKIAAASVDDLNKKINRAIGDAAKAIARVRTAVSEIYGDMDTLDAGLAGSEKSLRSLSGGLDETIKTLISMQDGCQRLSDLFDSFADSDMLADVNHLMQNDAEVIAERMASPVQMDRKEIYPVDHFGSAMAAFYIALAQWIGALFATVMIKAQIRRREDLLQMRLHERFFGRYRLFLMVGLAQALIMSLGALLYVGIQCIHPVLFVLAACVNGIVLTLFMYSLVFALESIGLAAGVVLMILQVTAAGGLFPIEMVPKTFQALHPFMPLTYSIRAYRECIGGMYDGTYLRCLGILVLFAAGAVCFGLLAYRPMRKLIEIVDEAKEESDLML